jgi:isoquinoline 1-oxidoreductase beta subunit
MTTHDPVPGVASDALPDAAALGTGSAPRASADAVRNVSRRGFLQGVVGAGALVLGARLGRASSLPGFLTGPTAGAAIWEPDVFLAIDEDGSVTIVAHRSEMGTGIRTCLPVVVADELGADWSRCRIEQAIGDEKYGSQNTDGSRSIRFFYKTMRRVGATARTMLQQAAAKKLGVSAAECSLKNHVVTHTPSGKTVELAEIVQDAAKLEAPDWKTLTYRSPSDWRYVGKDFPLYDLRDLTTGGGTFGIDAKVDGMVYAMVERCPVVGGAVKDIDLPNAGEGIEVFEIPPFEGAPGFQPLGGVAILGPSTWAVLSARRKLKVTWDLGENKDYDSKSYREQLLATVRKPGKPVRKGGGDTEAALEACKTKVVADYYLPHLAHASMEPPCALAVVRDDGTCECWAPTQNPQAARDQVAGTLGIDKKDVTVHVTLLGGGFGRKSKPDHVAEAAWLSKQCGKPVKVVWTREDDIRHDYYHSVAAVHCEMGAGADGKAKALLARTAFPPIPSTFAKGADEGSSGELSLGFVDAPFDLEAIRLEVCKAKAHVRIGWLRAVSNVWHAFAMCSIVDELAHAVGRDPLEFLLETIGPARHVDLQEDRVQYGNYGSPIDDYPIDTGRLRRVTELVASRGGWGLDLPKGSGRGLAVHRSFTAYVAVCVQTEVTPDGQVRVPRVDIALDAGLVVNPDRVRAQMEGSVVFGHSIAMTGEITAKDGAIEQSNFDTYPVARIDDAPREIHVHLVDNPNSPPCGVGEPGVPPYAPALANAIYAATGGAHRVRELPISKLDLSWG